MNDKNLFSIGEIAKAVGVTRKTILNYESKGMITPDKKERTRTHCDSVKEITIEPQTIYCRTYNSKTIADKTNLL